MKKFKLYVNRFWSFLKQIDKAYLKAKYHQIRNLKWSDIKNFARKNKKYVIYAVLAVVAILILIPIATYLFFVRDLSSKERILNKKNAGVVLLDRHGTPFFTLFEATTKNPVDLEDLPKYTPYAFVAVEDKDFYKHPGFSLSGIGRAVRENILSESFAQGGSTISQQLIKNAILSPDKRLLRKYQELVLALELERRYNKNDILELYINTNYYGEGAFGIEDAAKRYFSKDAKDLTLGESALLAGIIRAPSYYSPISGSLEDALKRKDLILKLMHDQGYITEQEMKAAQSEEIVINPTEREINEEAVHFALMVQDQLIEEYGEQDVANSGFTVKTTLDLPLQKAAQQAVETQVARLASSKVSNGAAVAIDPNNGQILALVGSHDWDDEENGRINMALRPRQPGSSFKPIIYAKAFEEKKITPSTMLKDEPIVFGTYKPRNYNNQFKGEVLARYALANSLNIPALHVMDMIGVPAGIEMAQDLGITTLDEDKDYGLPLVLGAAEVPLIEMTNAYATFANEGEWNMYSSYTEIRDKNGKVVDTYKGSKKRALPNSVSYLIWSILSDPKARAETFGNSLTLSRPAAVKTGTTEDNRDALTIGFAPQIAVGVWIGNNDNSPMSSVAGASGAAPVWRIIMESYLKGKLIETYRVPVGVTDEQVCVEDGLKIDFATSSAYTEYFLRGTAPSKMCALITPTPTPQNNNSSDNNNGGNNNNGNNNPTPTPQPQQPTSTPTPTQTVSLPTLLTPTPSDTPTPTPTP